MSVWITGRKPTQDDADSEGNVLTANVGITDWQSVISYWVWMRNPAMPPEPPKPRTLEDVVREYLPIMHRSKSIKENLNDAKRLRDEMKEILERD